MAKAGFNSFGFCVAKLGNLVEGDYVDDFGIGFYLAGRSHNDPGKDTVFIVNVAYRKGDCGG
jgi:hypothetical protein